MNRRRTSVAAIAAFVCALGAHHGAASAGDRLTRTEIVAGMKTVRDKFADCGTKHSAGSAKVVIKVNVRPAGAVKSVSVSSTPDKELGRCVAKAMRYARFAKTTKGGSFSWPVAFRGTGTGSKQPAPSAGAVKDKLDRSDIKKGIATVRDEVKACIKHGTGVVKLSVAVTPAGAVGSAMVKSAPSKDLGSCVADEVKRASFDKSKKGATFVYPFVFR